MDFLTFYTLVPAVPSVVSFIVWAWERWHSKEARKGVSAWLVLSIVLLVITFIAYKKQPPQATLGEESEKTRTAMGDHFEQTQAQVSKVQQTTNETQRLLRSVREAIDQALRVTEQTSPSPAALHAQFAALNLAKASAEQIPDVAVRHSLVYDISRVQLAAMEKAQKAILNTAVQPPPAAAVQAVGPKAEFPVIDQKGSSTKTPTPTLLIVSAPTKTPDAAGSTKTVPNSTGSEAVRLVRLTGFSYTYTGNPDTGPLSYNLMLAGDMFDPSTVEVALDGPGCLPPFISNASLINKTPTTVTLPNVTIPKTGCTAIAKNAGGESVWSPFPIAPLFISPRQ